MNLINQFLLCFHKRMKDVDPETRNRVLQKVLDNYEELGVFAPLSQDWDELDEDFEEEVTVEDAPILEDREDLIRKKQKELGIEPGEPPQELETTGNRRWGRSELHEAVMMGDEGFVKRLIDEGHDVDIKDNNGHTIVQVALLEENESMIKFFRKMGLLN